ncbi:hypothetical protein MKZ38_005550 [Zalerion maritima]|uniref:Uncharacterized protein n=1 Tax=Zalerion maritima TaxID=339359 RepID=A0AAD5WP88_9PEZI|nr:hypothetical protein MKZ38_005550 [Zalerion maritima]
MAIFANANCTYAPAEGASDAGVAGAGVLLSFMMTAFVGISLSASIIFSERGHRTSPSTIRRKLLNGYSDQQLITGIGIQSVGLAKINTMLPYHFFLIWMLGLMSTATHNATLLALVRDFRRDWVLRWLRQFLMFVNLALSCICGVFILRAVTEGLTRTTLPIACALQDGVEGDEEDGGENVGLAFAGTIAVIAGNCVVFFFATWYLHARSQRFYKIVQMVGLVVMFGIAVGASVRVGLLSQAFGTPSVPLADEGEKEWSFGQLLSLLMLLLPLVSVVEISRGDVKVAPPVADEKGGSIFEGAQELGNTVTSGRESFQPNPFFGSQTNLFKR